MTEPASTERTPLMVRCGQCEHRWPVVYLPMEAGRAARTMAAARCPMCGSTSRDHRLADDTLTWPPQRAAASDQPTATPAHTPPIRVGLLTMGTD